MTLKQLLRCVGFVLVLCVLLLVLCDLFEQENTANYDMRYQSFKSYPRGTVDAVFMGTSGVDRYWISAKAYEEYGMVVYPLGINNLPSNMYLYMLKDVLSRQDPQLLIVDMRAFQQANTAEMLENRSRYLLDAMDFFSVTRIQAALRTMKQIHELDESKPEFDLSLLLSFIKYHPKWAEEDYRIANNLGDKMHQYGGFYMYKPESIKKAKLKLEEVDKDAVGKLDAAAEASLHEFLDFLSGIDQEVLFIYTPQVDSPTKIKRLNAIRNILDERGFDHLIYQMVDPEDENYMDLDLNGDFYDKGHVNYYGAEKFTAEFAVYLDEQYNLPDRRGDEEVQRIWNGIYDKIKNDIASYEKK